MPTCIRCDDQPETQKQSIQSRLMEELARATTEHEDAKAAYNKVMWDIPSAIPHPDGVQRIHSISRELAVVKERLARAHCRLADFLDTGAIPEDLEYGG